MHFENKKQLDKIAKTILFCSTISKRSLLEMSVFLLKNFVSKWQKNYQHQINTRSIIEIFFNINGFIGTTDFNEVGNVRLFWTWWTWLLLFLQSEQFVQRGHRTGDKCIWGMMSCGSSSFGRQDLLIYKSSIPDHYQILLSQKHKL